MVFESVHECVSQWMGVVAYDDEDEPVRVGVTMRLVLVSGGQGDTHQTWNVMERSM